MSSGSRLPRSEAAARAVAITRSAAWNNSSSCTSSACRAALEEERGDAVRRHAEAKRMQQRVRPVVLGVLGVGPTGLEVDQQPLGAHGLRGVGAPQHQVDLARDDERAAEELGAHRKLGDRRQIATQLAQRREGPFEQRRAPGHLHQQVVLLGRAQIAPVLREPLLLVGRARRRHQRRRVRVERLARADDGLDRSMLDHADRGGGVVRERGRLTRELGPEHALALAKVVQSFLAQPEHVGELEPASGLLDPIAQPLGEVGGEHRPLGADQLLERAPLRFGQLHASMLGGDTDMPENPDDILRALADPERLTIAGLLARGDRTADELADELGISPKRVRTHVGKLTAAGIARIGEDRRTYRLDPGTLRRAAELVGPPREAGLALGAATDDEELVLRTFFRNGRLTEIPMKQTKRRIVLERIALEFEPGRRYERGGQRHRRRVLQRSRGDPTLSGRRGLPGSGLTASIGAPEAGSTSAEPAC